MTNTDFWMRQTLREQASKILADWVASEDRSNQRIKELEELLKEVVISMGCHCSPMNHVCLNCSFKNKPEVKKILEKV